MAQIGAAIAILSDAPDGAEHTNTTREKERSNEHDIDEADRAARDQTAGTAGHDDG